MTFVQVVDGTAETADTGTATTTISTTAGNTLVMIVVTNLFYGATTVSSISDSATNTWTKASNVTTTSGAGDLVELEVWYCQNASHVTSVVAHSTGSPPVMGITVFEISNCGPLIAATTTAAATTGSWSHTYNPAGLQGAQTIFVGAMGCDSTKTALTAITGSTLDNAPATISNSYTGGTNHDAGVQYAYAYGTAPSGSLTANWTQGLTLNHVTIALAFSVYAPGVKFINASSAADGGSQVSSLACNVPNGMADNNIMVCSVTVPQGDTVAQGSWSQLAAPLNASTGVVTYTFYRICSSEPTSYTFTINATTTVAINIMGFSGNATVNPIRTTGTATGASSTSVTSATLTGVQADDMVVILAGARPEASGSPTIATPTTAGWTAPAAAKATGGGAGGFESRCSASYATNGAAGAVTTTLSCGIAVISAAIIAAKVPGQSRVVSQVASMTGNW